MDTEYREFLLKEIDVLQSIIKRMVDNSFDIKKWTVVLAANHTVVFIVNL